MGWRAPGQRGNRFAVGVLATTIGPCLAIYGKQNCIDPGYDPRLFPGRASSKPFVLSYALQNYVAEEEGPGV